jgi:hypothetical protein
MADKPILTSISGLDKEFCIYIYVTRHDISRLMEVKRHKEKKRRQSVALRNRAPVTPAITFSTTVPIAKDIHAYNLS